MFKFLKKKKKPETVEILRSDLLKLCRIQAERDLSLGPYTGDVID